MLASGSAPRMLTDRLRVLDPLCGRGTTLNQVLMYGWHAAGVDIDSADFDTYAAFLPRWLKDKRLKHTATTAKLRRDGRTLGRRLDVELATSKQAWAAGDTITLSTALADTREAAEVFKAASFDALVTDAPYGVQHGSRSAGGLQRRPLELLAEALPGWSRLLRPGGAVGIAINVRTCPRDEALALLRDTGLEPRDTAAYRGFEHRVDQAILRDLVVGVRPDEAVRSGVAGADGRTVAAKSGARLRASFALLWRHGRAGPLTPEDLGLRPAQGGRGAARGCRRRAHRLRGARPAARGDVRRPHLRRPGPDHARPPVENAADLPVPAGRDAVAGGLRARPRRGTWRSWAASSARACGPCRRT